MRLCAHIPDCDIDPKLLGLRVFLILLWGIIDLLVQPGVAGLQPTGDAYECNCERECGCGGGPGLRGRGCTVFSNQARPRR